MAFLPWSALILFVVLNEAILLKHRIRQNVGLFCLFFFCSNKSRSKRQNATFHQMTSKASSGGDKTRQSGKRPQDFTLRQKPMDLSKIEGFQTFQNSEYQFIVPHTGIYRLSTSLWQATRISLDRRRRQRKKKEERKGGPRGGCPGPPPTP